MTQIDMSRVKMTHDQERLKNPQICNKTNEKKNLGFLLPSQKKPY